jgi:predicted component of type VI protein secretion system
LARFLSLPQEPEKPGEQNGQAEPQGEQPQAEQSEAAQAETADTPKPKRRDEVVVLAERRRLYRRKGAAVPQRI